MNSKPELIAFGDESIRISAPVPAYLLAATVIPEDCNLSRIASIKPKGATKLHWRDLTDRLKNESLREIAAIRDQTTTIVSATPLPKKKQERGRRKCLEVLLPELERKGVATLVLESRMLELDKRDIEMLQVMRTRKLVTAIRLEHARANEDMRLWIPDQILGAYGDVLCHAESVNKWEGPWEEIYPHITILNTSL